MSGEKDRKQEILDAALEVFSQHGYHKASIKKIANAAGLKSPALIYWYFEDKKALLFAVLHTITSAPWFGELSPDAQAEIMQQPPGAFLTSIGVGFLGILNSPQRVSIMQFIISEAVRTSEVAEFANEFQRQGLSFFETYFETQIDAGLLRPHDVGITTRIFMGSLITYIMSYTVFPALSDELTSPEIYVTQLVETLLEGIGTE